MNSDGQAFLERLATFPTHPFESRFANISTRLNLARELNESELTLLLNVAYLAGLCNIALNGLGGCQGRITPENERNRTRLEWDFLAARDRFYTCAGWREMPDFKQAAIGRIFFNVLVNEENLAW